MTQPRAEIVAWVGRHILPHEADVRAWLRRCGASPEDADDIVQEAYCRLATLDSVAHIVNGRAYLFQTARNIGIERLRRAKIVRIDHLTEIELADVVDSGPSPERITADRNELRRVQALIEELPDRCRQIFKLRRIHGVPQREVARLLSVTENVVELQVMRGVRLILKRLAEDEGSAAPQTAPAADDRPARRRGRGRPFR